MIRIDARGMRCPWPAVRLARALRDGADAVTVLADDPKAPAEIATVAADAGAVVETREGVTAPEFLVTIRPNRNGVFTQSG